MVVAEGAEVEGFGLEGGGDLAEHGVFEEEAAAGAFFGLVGGVEGFEEEEEFGGAGDHGAEAVGERVVFGHGLLVEDLEDFVFVGGRGV